jgi:hypothetical protein
MKSAMKPAAPLLLLLLLLLLLCELLEPASAWLAVSPPSNGNLDVWQLDDTGARVKDVLTFPLSDAGERVDAGAMACGRCFCLILGTNAAANTSTLYNMSFCIVPTPALESAVPLAGIAYNVHSNEGEGDGGAGYTLLVTHPQGKRGGKTGYNVVRVSSSGAVSELVDISPYVDQFSGSVYPGGTAFCAETLTLWVAVQTKDPARDTLLTVDLQSRAVTANISIVKPALAAHFADCSTNSVGGVTQTSDGKGGSTVVLGMLTAAGAFTVLDQLALPANSKLLLSGAADYMHDPRLPWANFEYGALLYTGGTAMPGGLFTSSAGKSGPAKLGALADVAAAISVEY